MGRSSLSLIPVDGAEAADRRVKAIAAGLPLIAADSAGELVQISVLRALEEGHRVPGARSSSELLNQTLCQRNLRRRVIATPHSSFNPAVAVARLIWHLGARSDLTAIEFYEPRARLFSDDGVVLPGSNTGARLFGGGDGSDQIRGLIARLREDPSSRRAMGVVWRPEDAVRESRDIPCTLALACHLREGQLETTVTMRSNNALRLLPYNLFEYTMLAELIAVEIGAQLGFYWHSALSLHVFDNDLEAAKILLEGENAAGAAMPPMPGPNPLEEAARLVAHEEKLRSAFLAEAWGELPSLTEQAEAELHPYWFGLYALLAVFCTARAGGAERMLDIGRLKKAVPPALRPVRIAG